VFKIRFKTILVIMGLAASIGYPQVPGTSLSGRVEFMDGPADLYVELREMGNGLRTQKESVASDGTFHFRDLPNGSYEVRVVSALHNDTLMEEFVDVNPFNGQLVLRLPRAAQTKPVSGVVSVRELQSRPPKKALEAFVRAQHFSEASKPAEAIDQLRRAIELDPKWRDAHLNLGVELMRASRFEEALAEMQEAIRIGPATAMVYTNYAAVLATLRRPAEGEKIVRQALRLDPSCWRAHYLLGHILALQTGHDEEALDQLRTGAAGVPSGHIIAAQVLARRGDREGAAGELRAYLESGDKTHRVEVQKSLTELQQ
jgi:tetratricopeptide (TPR) repeat protein